MHGQLPDADCLPGHSDTFEARLILRRSRRYSNTIGSTEIATMMIRTSSMFVRMNGRLPRK